VHFKIVTKAESVSNKNYGDRVRILIKLRSRAYLFIVTEVMCVFQTSYGGQVRNS